MTNKKLKTLAAVIACTMALGAAPSVPGTSSLPAVTTTVEAAAKNVTLKVSGKKVKVGKKVKLPSAAVICHGFVQNGKEIIQIFISDVHLK